MLPVSAALAAGSGLRRAVLAGVAGLALAGVLPMIPEFIVLDRLIQSAPAVLNKALAAGDDAAKNYDAVKREIQAVTR